MRKKWLLVAGTVGALGLGAWTLKAAPPDGGGPPPTQPDEFGSPQQNRPLGQLVRAEVGRWMTLRAEMDVTRDQREKIHGILESHHKEIVDAIKPIVLKHRALRDAVTAPNPDEKAIRAAADDLGHAIGDASVLAAKIKGEVAGVLTDEQRQRVGEFRTQSDEAIDRFFQKIADGAQ